MLKQLRSTLVLLFVMMGIVGGVYPLAVTFLGQALFPYQAGGSLMRKGDTVVGSALIGQSFRQPGFFWGRPSAGGYDANGSGAANGAPSSKVWVETLTARVAELRWTNPGEEAPIPVDLVTASASGLDPHISLVAAQWQVKRISAARHLPEDSLKALIETHAEGNTFGILGEPRVNVLRLNTALENGLSDVR